jgi:N-acetylneuraminate synthase
MCGAPGTQKRLPPEKEITYLDSLIRGVYAKHPLQAGQKLTPDDIYLAIPLLRGQLSCREFMHGEVLTQNCGPDQAVLIDMIDGPHARNKGLRDLIHNRGLDPESEPVAAKSLVALSEAIGETEVQKEVVQ